MPRYCKLSRSRVLRESLAITRDPLADVLLPPIHNRLFYPRSNRYHAAAFHQNYVSVEAQFFAALRQASSCSLHRAKNCNGPTQQRRHAATASQSDASLQHQRFDSKGRLIIETTASRQPAFSYEDHGNRQFFNSEEHHFAASTQLPPSFFTDVNMIRNIQVAHPSEHERPLKRGESQLSKHTEEQPEQSNVKKQLDLIQSIRALEEKLAQRKDQLKRAMEEPIMKRPDTTAVERKTVLTKKDYLNLVDLYFYSHNSRFSPESSDASPTPTILNDYSFTLSADFSVQNYHRPDVFDDADEDYVSPLKAIEEQLKQNKLKEIAVMQVFIDLLLDDDSANKALYEAYQELPQPGVAYLPAPVLRLLLQRMSTPWLKSHAAMLRYLALIEDMQQAKVPITVAEWSSAIYLAGRSFNRINLDEVGRAFNVWQQMEKDAGVTSSNVTFNILFDVAVRAGKFALGETILAEMHKRNLRLNRLGRVSLMYYHGLRGDGDGVRKAYHDFVEAGEIVDTLVLNCVVASLINAQEPTAAEQIYQRMKDMQKSLQRERGPTGEETLFRLHPEPGSTRIGQEMASNSLGRILLRGPHLQKQLPDHHSQLQAAMPLTPNFTTFRIMIAYHAAVSGNLDRITVLIKEMLDNFDIPLFPIVFQLLFKGFAIHGPKGGPDSEWSRQRLDMVWNACRTALLDSMALDDGVELAKLNELPKITEVNEGMDIVREAVDAGQPKARTLSMWQELVIDLAAFPRQRLKRLQRFASTQFDETPVDEFKSPFFQKAHYAAPQPELDEEEGEYSLPDPVNSSIVHTDYEKFDPYNDDDPQSTQDVLSQPRLGYEELEYSSSEADMDEELDRPPSAPMDRLGYTSFSSFKKFTDNPRDQYRLRATRPLVCWLLRAYSRVTASRAQVEEVYGAARKLWRPKDDAEAQHVMRVLMRSLRDCDRQAGRGDIFR